MQAYEEAQDDDVFGEDISFGSCIKQLRKNIGFTQSKLAEQLKDVKGINQTVLSKLEKDEINLSPVQRKELYKVLTLKGKEIAKLEEKWKQR